jgi:hypothetical protein
VELVLSVQHEHSKGFIEAFGLKVSWFVVVVVAVLGAVATLFGG